MNPIRNKKDLEQSVEEINLISSGWANREYNDSETVLLINKLKDLYFGVSRGHT